MGPSTQNFIPYQALKIKDTMPTPLKHSQNMRKHLTNAERAARQAAEAALEAKRPARITPPKWLDQKAISIFKSTVKRLRDFDLLEPIDIDMLAMYADALARYQDGIATMDESNVKEIQAVQAWSRIALTYADKLGFSQTARARLARRKAQEETLDPMEQLLGSVTDFVNGDE